MAKTTHLGSDDGATSQFLTDAATDQQAQRRRPKRTRALLGRAVALVAVVFFALLQLVPIEFRPDPVLATPLGLGLGLFVVGLVSSMGRGK